MVTSHASPELWALIVVIGVATYLIRVSFIALFGYLDDIPTGLERALRYVPAAVLAALVVPSFVTLDPGAGGIAADRLAGGILATVVAWRTENVFATMAAGMGGLWLVRFVVLPLV
ncbi:AzlD domain-containing protein [Salinibaculum rarum]|jgi:branched-subunit amino acid transport protein|uniref:AzlD domain-containing protein n=1 Tax=Salinibaculum rarum TaxID=3058903 RepID=UPI00265EDBE3|nr:AzlD domain-containing protein [Salinibaculum sp. KK48]